MAVINQGILGGFSGKVGTVIGGSWKGIDYMRSKPISVANPRTPAQVDQRTKFVTVLNFLQPLTSILRTGFKDYAVKMSAFNAAMSYTIQNAISGIYPEYGITYADALVSRGSLTGALNPSVLVTTPGLIDFSWVDNSGTGTALATDKAMLVIYNSAKKQAVTINGGNTRASGSQEVMVPTTFTGDELNCYIAFQNENQSEVSNSTYLGEVVAL
ncbi:DUF6266 family protein [uncultured Sunxiuqinia sp.]|uniref:DUF6266 family protein n=1 Tax=uncultured Sunxiuqinia sp. TaxID=1573825 RepID=UPI00260E0FB7|nr:DUF6266 family protein [uncultured Sunxiuqinia sp.]